MSNQSKASKPKPAAKLKDIKPGRDAKGGGMKKPLRPLGSGTGTGGTTGGGH